MDAAIRETHPRPFARASEEEYDAAVKALRRDIPRLADHDIVLRLVSIVALIEDGHTRLAIPRQNPALGLEFGHTGTEPPEDARLHFVRYPAAFEQFADGLFIVAADGAHKAAIGKKVVAVGGVPADKALAAMYARAVGDIRNDIVINCGCCGEGEGKVEARPF